MFTNNSYYTLLFLMLFTLTSFAQLETESVQDDSIDSSLKSEFKLRFNSSQQFQSPLFIIKQPIIFDEYSLFFPPDLKEDVNDNNVSMMQLRNEINQSMNVFRQGQNKYQLGVVGDILGYISTAAAAGLAVYHVHKHRKYYGVK